MKKSLYLGLAIAAAGLLIYFCYLKKQPTTTPSSSPHFVFSDASFHFQFLRIIGYSVVQATDINECWMAARNIIQADFESWYYHWHALAERLKKDADSTFKENHYESAKGLYLRASNYYRAAEFYLHGNPHDQRIVETARKGRECFLAFIALEKHIEALEIPYENTTLPAYFYAVDNPKATLIIQTGFDGTQEELYVYAQQATKRGYNVLTFEGPGQGRVIREQELPMRADWEQVVTPVIDYLSTRHDVKMDKLILYGLSLGGYLAPRAASKDKRIKILIANGGVYDPVEGIVQAFKIAPSKEAFVEMLKHAPEEVDAVMRAMMGKDTIMRWFIEHGMYIFQVKTPAAFYLKYSDLTMHGHAHDIQSVALICDSEQEQLALAGQARTLFDHLTTNKSFMLFTAQEGAEFHCQVGALLRSTERIYDWLDDTVQKI